MANLIQEDNEAPAAGRGPGIDWVTERTFETGTSSNEFERQYLSEGRSRNSFF